MSKNVMFVYESHKIHSSLPKILQFMNMPNKIREEVKDMNIPRTIKWIIFSIIMLGLDSTDYCKG